MLLALRKILFYLLSVLYLVITPTTIFSALGYRIGPDEIALVKTGLLAVETVPRGASIFLENRRYARKSPAAIRGLLPGRYRVRFALKDHIPWEKQVEIFSEKTTELEPVILLPQRPEIEQISGKPYRGLVPGLAERGGISGLVDFKMMAWDGKYLDSLSKIDVFFRKGKPAGREFLHPEKMRILKVFSKRDSDLAVFEVEENGDKGFLPVGIDDDRIAKNLRRPLKIKADFVHWDPKNTQQIYFLERSNLIRLDTRRGALYPGLATSVLGFGVTGNRLYLLKDNFSFVSSDLNGENPEPVFKDAFLGPKIFRGLDAQYYEVDVLTNDLILFLSDRGTLLSNRIPYIHVLEGVRGLDHFRHFLGDEKILYWTNNEVGVIDFSQGKNGGVEKGPGKRVLYEKGKDVQQAFWCYDDSHVLFLDQDRVHILEAKGPRPYQVREVTAVRPASRVDYSDKNQTLFYLDRGTGYLMKRKIPD